MYKKQKHLPFGGSELVEIEQIRLVTPFSEFLTINKYSMKIQGNRLGDRGYLHVDPIFLWGRENKILIGNYETYVAIKQNKLKYAPVYFVDFKDTLHALSCILNSRYNLKNAEIYRVFDLLDDPSFIPADSDILDLTNLKLATMLNICPRTLQNIITIRQFGTEEIQKAFISGKMSARKGAALTNANRKITKGETN